MSAGPRWRAGKPEGGDSKSVVAKLPQRHDHRNGRIYWVRFWIERLRGETASLSPAAFGAYMRFVLEQLRRQEPIPDDTQTLRAITGVHSSWSRIKRELLTILELRDGMLSDPYAESYIRDFHEKSARNRRNIAKRWNAGASAEIEDASDE